MNRIIFQISIATSIDGNLLSGTAQQDIKQLRVIMDAMDDYSKLFDRQNVRDKFLDKYCKEALNCRGFKAKSKQKYLNSLKHFYEFLMVKKLIFIFLQPI